MKDMYRRNSPDFRYEFRSQATPPSPQEKPKITFPEGPKKIENGKLKENGKKKSNKPHKKQPTLWTVSGS